MIELNGVSYKYPDGNLAINNISLNLKEGEITAIIGKNGSGKSTLLSTIANLYKFKGNISIDNVDIKKIHNKDFRKKVGIVFQNPNNQIIFPSVEENLKFVLDNLDFDEPVTRIKEALKIVSMEKYYKSNAYNLSLGQKQRIALASVLVTYPKYLLLDEITSMLDYQGKKSIYDLILKLKNEGIGIIMGTNILEELIYADKIIILDNEIKEILTKKELFDNLDILLKYNFDIPFNLKVIKKLINKIDINEIDEDEIVELINE